jgi:3-phenylpropionate/trans-cinnamate dioxygenase ferredoxin reductase subunit
MTKSVVIIGAGHGGVQAAASLREDGFDGAIHLVSSETDLPYHKPPLSKTFIKDEAAQPQPLRGEVFYSGHNIQLDFGKNVERIDARGRKIIFHDGVGLAYDRLIIATGARPRLLPQGHNLAGVLVLRTLDDARAIRDAAAHAEDVVVIGAGFIGLEIAATLSAGGRKVTVVEALARPLGRAVARPIAEHVTARLIANGVRILTETRIEGLVGEGGKVAGVALASGQTLPAQLVVVGIGVAPNVELASAAGLTCDNGIRVDGSMQTSAENILAIGDCVNYRHWMTGTDVRLESVQNATDQARLAALTILDRPASYDAVPWFWSDIGDMKLQMVGLIGREDRHVVVGSPEENRFSVYHFAGERLTAIESVNKPADHMLGRKMLATEFSPSPDALAANPEGLKAAFTDWQQRLSSAAPGAL